MIVRPRYLGLIAAGRKRVEARLMRCRRVPLGCVRPGDVVYFKPTGGPVRCRARVTRVRQWSGLYPADVARLERRYGREVAAEAEFWHARRGARHAVLVWFADPQPIRRGPQVARQYGCGWVVLP